MLRVFLLRLSLHFPSIHGTMTNPFTLQMTKNHNFPNSKSKKAKYEDNKNSSCIQLIILREKVMTNKSQLCLLRVHRSKIIMTIKSPNYSCFLYKQVSTVETVHYHFQSNSHYGKQCQVYLKLNTLN